MWGWPPHTEQNLKTLLKGKGLVPFFTQSHYFYLIYIICNCYIVSCSLFSESGVYCLYSWVLHSCVTWITVLIWLAPRLWTPSWPWTWDPDSVGIMWRSSFHRPEVCGAEEPRSAPGDGQRGLPTHNDGQQQRGYARTQSTHAHEIQNLLKGLSSKFNHHLITAFKTSNYDFGFKNPFSFY